jgi:dethiobiotin synthetase
VSTVVLTGTATEVGKTWWGRATIEILIARGVAVAARKPAQSYAPDELGHTDAEILGHASREPAETVCPRHRWYAVPMAPPMAADVLGLPTFTIGDLVTEIAPSPPGAVTIVEGAGGPRSPLAADGDSITLARALPADVVVLVAPAGLGTINAVRLCADTLRTELGDPVRLVVALNRYDAGDDLHRRNHGWLAREGLDLVLTPAELADRLARGAAPGGGSATG